MTGPEDFWALGDYAAVAPRLQPLADDLVDVANLVHGSRVLDVAAGTGNVSVAASQRGARVLACDISPAMIEAGRARTRADKLHVEWRECDAQSLPLPDRAFDAALSAFGVMFAPDPDRAAGELLRVVRPGGTVALASWSDAGVWPAVNEPIAEALSFEGPNPLDWGDPELVRARFGNRVRSLDVFEREASWVFADVDEACAWFELGAGWASAQATVDPGVYEELQVRKRAAVERFAQPASGGGVELRPVYLVVRARVR